MKSISGMRKWLAFAAALFIAVEVRATQLTFSIYTDSNKTTQVAAGTAVPQGYGDNVTNFDPSAPVSGQYYRYGTNGGLTPHISVAYRVWNNPGDNGGANGSVWTTGYGNLTNVLYPNLTFQEIRFTADFGYRITLSNFDIASFTLATTGQTVKVVRNAGLPSATTLWSAGPDGTVTVNGGAGVHDSYTPNVMVADGATLSLIYASSGNVGADNIVFIESIPEPTAAAMAITGCLFLLPLRRRQ